MISQCFFWQYHIVQVCINVEGQQYDAEYLSVFFWQYHIVQVCYNIEGQQYDAGYLSVSSDNSILYRYALM